MILDLESMALPCHIALNRRAGPVSMRQRYGIRIGGLTANCRFDLFADAKPAKDNAQQIVRSKSTRDTA